MALDNILCGRAWSSEQQCEMLVELAVRYVLVTLHASVLTEDIASWKIGRTSF